MPQPAGKHSNLSTARTEARGGLKREESLRERGRAVLAYLPSIAMMFWSGLNHGARLRRGGLDRSSAQGEEMGTRIKWYIPEEKKVMNCFQILMLKGGMN